MGQAGESQVHPAAETIQVQPYRTRLPGPQQRGGLVGRELSRTRLGEDPVLDQVAQHPGQRLRVGSGAFGQVAERGPVAGAVIGHEVRQPQGRGDPQRHRGHQVH